MTVVNVPWVNGTVQAVAEDLRKSRRSSPDNPDLVYAAAMGMVEGLARDLGRSRPCEDRVADIRTVVEALHLVNSEEPDQ